MSSSTAQDGRASFGPDRVGAQPADAAPRVPAHGDRRRRGPARRGRRRARLGERRPRLVRPLLGDDALDRPRRPRRLTRSARLGEHGLMTFFFFVVGLEARREFDLGRAARAAAVRAAAAGGRSAAWRSRSRSTWRSTPAARRRTAGAIAMSTDTAFALGAARARRAALPRPPARVHAHGRRRRRHRRARRHRDGLHRDARCRCRCSSRCGFFAAVLVAARAPACASGVVYVVLGAAAWVGAARVGRRAGRRRAGRWACSSYAVPGAAIEPRARHRAVPRVPRAADGRARAPRRRRSSGRRRLAERAAAAALPPLDELRRSCRCSRSRTRASRIDRDFLARAVHARRSRSGSWSATSSASRVGILGSVVAR